LRGLLASGHSRARLWGNRIVGNGGDISSEPGLGGVAVTDSALADLGGGAVEIDGDATSSPGDNALCENLAFTHGPRDLDNLAAGVVHAERNYWCNMTPMIGVEGPSEILPFLFEAPSP
jgi:hypothetical protein